jgi:hypothetical protein
MDGRGWGIVRRDFALSGEELNQGIRADQFGPPFHFQRVVASTRLGAEY